MPSAFQLWLSTTLQEIPCKSFREISSPIYLGFLDIHILCKQGYLSVPITEFKFHNWVIARCAMDDKVALIVAS